jgi:hypothetical protein
MFAFAIKNKNKKFLKKFHLFENLFYFNDFILNFSLIVIQWRLKEMKIFIGVRGQPMNE